MGAQVGSLEEQVIAAFEGMRLALSTRHNYIRQAKHFVRYCQAYHGCTTLEGCRPYADEWLASRSHLSAFTQEFAATVLAKLYDCPRKDFIRFGGRNRENIKRSRGIRVRDRFFCEERHRDFVAFCRSTGLKRSELKALTGDQLRIEEGDTYIEMPGGGQPCNRKVPVIGEVGLVVAMMQAAGTGRVFRQVYTAADIQSYRADYAKALYRMHARDLETCKRTPFVGERHPSGHPYRDSVYNLHGAREGEWLDRQAMKLVTDALGLKHFRSFGENYLG